MDERSTRVIVERSKKAVRRLKERVAALLRSGSQQPWQEAVRQLNWILRGWANYFCHGTWLQAYRAIDDYVYHRAANFLRRRHKVRHQCMAQYSDEAIFGKFTLTSILSHRGKEVFELTMSEKSVRNFHAAKRG